MSIKFKKLIFFIALVLFLIPKYTLAQELNQLTSDSLFTLARNIPKEKANYPKITQLLNLALTKSPRYADIRMFLGRVYTWDDNLDSARYQFNQVLSDEPNNIEAYNAIVDLEYWNNNYHRALDQSTMGLLYKADDSDLAIKKAKILLALERTNDAKDFLKNYISIYPNNEKVNEYYKSLIAEDAKNQINIGYEYVHFDKRFNDPWHYVSLGYTRKTAIGSISANLLYSNRFNTNGLAGEIETYPSITKGIYAYLGFGFSNSPTFYKYRSGVSLYYVLPKGFDAETGFRYLDFDPSKTYIYVLALGKYVGNYYFNLKTYLTPSLNTYSQSFTFSMKYYFSDRYNALGMQIGMGVSPDDRLRSSIGLVNLRAYKLGLNYGKDLSKTVNLGLSALWYYEEYSFNTWGNQLSAGVSLIKKF